MHQRCTRRDGNAMSNCQGQNIRQQRRNCPPNTGMSCDKGDVLAETAAQQASDNVRKISNAGKRQRRQPVAPPETPAALAARKSSSAGTRQRRQQLAPPETPAALENRPCHYQRNTETLCDTTRAKPLPGTTVGIGKIWNCSQNAGISCDKGEARLL